MALDASSTPTVVTELEGGTSWTINGYETNASTAETLVAAPGAGFSLYIEEVVITSDTAAVDPQLEDEDANVLVGRFFTTTTSPLVVSHKFKHPIKLVSNKALNLKCAGAGNVSFYVAGRTKRDLPRG